MKSIAQLVTSRRTINQFKPNKPDNQLIVNAIELASWSPNHHLTQPWHFYLPSADMINQIIALNTQIVTKKKGAEAGLKKQKKWQSIPGWLIVTCEKSIDKLTYSEDYAACCCAVYGLSLVLWDQDIGVKWTTGEVTRDPKFYNICWLDQTCVQVVGLIWYGYPEQVPEPQIRHKANQIITIY